MIKLNRPTPDSKEIKIINIDKLALKNRGG